MSEQGEIVGPKRIFGAKFDTSGYSKEELASWDQRNSLKPAPYKYGMARFVKGLNRGDPMFDAMPVKDLLCHGAKAKEFKQQEEPEWLDWAKLKRGQKLWFSQLSRSYYTLGVSLLQGFSIARFGEVLVKNGYAQDGRTAMFRYMDTAHAISDWIRYPLDEPTSPARTSLYTVRAMHAFARRKSMDLFSPEKGEGIPLSQFDMGEVLLGFSGICMERIEVEICSGVLTENMRDDMCYFWRYIGYHLGIEDEFNLCSSLEVMDAAVQDFMSWTPRRLETKRVCTDELCRTAIEGFGMQTGLGSTFWYAVFDLGFITDRMDLEHLRPKDRPLPGLSQISEVSRRLLAYEPVAKALAVGLLRSRDMKREDPVRFHKHLERLQKLATINDMIVWRVISFMYTVRQLIAALFIWRLLNRIPAFRRRVRLLLSFVMRA